MAGVLVHLGSLKTAAAVAREHGRAPKGALLPFDAEGVEPVEIEPGRDGRRAWPSAVGG